MESEHHLPIHKKGDEKKIAMKESLLNVVCKILASILCEKLKPHILKIFGSYQCGFILNRSTSEIFTLRQIWKRITSSKLTDISSSSSSGNLSTHRAGAICSKL
uniref:Reverse transcriptase domain-containing protein n=1 Tax=Megaselia scalaris TaxID=36166 RepID=T1GAT3_MEGSC